MDALSPIFLLTAYLLLPALIIYMIQRMPWLDTIGPVIFPTASG